MSDTALVQLDRAKLALAECKTAMEAKQIADVAEAARVYLERTNASSEAVNRATEVRILAERQMGDFLRQMPKNQGGDPVPHKNRVDEPPTLAEIGITKKQSARAQKLAEIPADELQDRIAVAKIDGKLSTAKVLLYPAGFSERAIRAGEAAEMESQNLWKLKQIWKKTKKADRAAFKAWINQEQP